MCKTVFICIVLTMGALYFTKDANELVIVPIEKMVEKVKRIAKNPLHAAEAQAKTVYDIDQGEPGCWTRTCGGKDASQAEYETALLEDTIVKIGALLAIGFGEAGAAIIATNMEQGGDVDPMLEGEKIMAVFGFCDIRNFTDSTEVLLEGVMVFVNEIAQIVHSTVDHFQGAANKNIGDAFLLVWKFEKDDVEDIGNGQLQLNLQSKRAQYLPDCALTAFLKIIAKINRAPMITKYRNNQKLNKRMPNYSVKMGFGLHIGWGIEGAIGSEYKIDASYLSPNVNMASRLEAATKQFGVPILISGQLYDSLSSRAKEICRQIDKVTVKGSLVPLSLYTTDCYTEDLGPSKNQAISKETSRKKRRQLKYKLEKEEWYSWHIIETSKELVQMRKQVTPQFFDRFNAGVKAYMDGNWSQSRKYLESGLELKPRDGPSETLLEVMSETDFEAPKDWPGYRELTEK